MSLKPIAKPPAGAVRLRAEFAANDPAPAPAAAVQPVAYSRGRGTYDNTPKQCEAATFAEFRDVVLATQSPKKGMTFVCAAFAKGESDDPKNKGANHWRGAKLAQPRRWFPFDVDRIDSREAFDALMAACEKWSGLAYETASSKPDAPRCRIILELARPVTRGEGVQLGPELAHALTDGLDPDKYAFDASVYRAEQPCYTPTKDAARRAFNGKSVNPDGLLLRARLATACDEPDEYVPDEADGGLPADVPDALSHVDPDARDVWLQVGMALHSTGDADAWDTWCNWSKRSAKFDADEQRKAWVSFHDKRDGVTLGTIYKLAKDAGWVRPERDKRDLSRTTRTASPEYRLLTGGEVQSMPALAWRIKGVLPARGLAQIYGPPGSGKSFLAFDMAAAIAGGRDWFGYRVTAAPVVYVALEGEAGFPQRTQAWCRSREQPLPDDMRLILQPLRITDGGDVAAMGKAITDAGLSGAVVIVDTQNQAAPDADENSSESMGRILAGGKRLAGLVEGVVVLVAHAGKDEARGVRGHSSQRAAMDASIKVSRNEDAREWCVDKAKDGADGAKHGFTLEAVKLGEDADGDPLTSCVVVRDDTLRARRKPSAGEAAGLKAYVVACERGQCRVDDFGGFAGLHLEDWRAVFYELSTADNAETKCRSFHRTRRDLAGHGHMSALHDVYLPTDQKILERGQEFANLRSQRHKGQNAQPDNPDKSGQVRLVRPDTKPDGQDNPL